MQLIPMWTNLLRWTEIGRLEDSLKQSGQDAVGGHCRELLQALLAR
jgi:hypothetical protein